MDKNEFKAGWNKFKNKIREKWNRLTDSDVSEIHGDYDQWMAKMQKHGYSKEQAQKEFQNWHPEQKGMQHEKGHMKEQDWRKEENEEMGAEESENYNEEKSSSDESMGKKYTPGQQPKKNQGQQKKPENRGWDDEGKKRKAG